jgi:hypothetical protein
MDSGLVILVVAALLVIGAVAAVQMLRKNARDLRISELLGGDNAMAKNESAADAKDGAGRRTVDSEVGAELFAEMFAMRSAMSELVSEVRSMHQTLSEISMERERERDRRIA